MILWVLCLLEMSAAFTTPAAKKATLFYSIPSLKKEGSSLIVCSWAVFLPPQLQKRLCFFAASPP